MAEPPAGWGDDCIRAAHLIAEDLSRLYPPGHAEAIRSSGWLYMDSQPGREAVRALSAHQRMKWQDDYTGRRAYVAALFLEAHGKKQK